MDRQMALSHATLLLLCLHLLLTAGRSHSLGSTSLAAKPSGVQEELDDLKDKISELETEPMALEPLQQDQGPVEAWKASKITSLGPQDSTFQTLQRLRSSRMKRNAKCFGGKLDRIGHYSRMGCNVLGRN